MTQKNTSYSILPIKRSLLINFALTLLLLVFVYLGFIAFPNSTAKSIDRTYGFYIQAFLAFLVLVGFLFNGKELFISIKKNIPPVRYSIGLLFIVLFVGVFTSQEVELQHRVLSDESSWESMGIQMFYNQRAGVCNQGIFENNKLTCYDEVNNFKGKTTALIYWGMFHFMEPNRDSALQLNFPLFLLSIVFIFYASFLIFKNPWIGLSSAVFLATMPKLIFQSRTATTEVAYIFFFSLVVVIIVLLKQTSLKWKHLLLVLPLLGLLAGTRQETLFSFTPIVLVYYPLWKKHFWGLPVLTSGLIFVCLPIIITIAAYKGFNFQGGEYEAHSFYNLFRNFWDNIYVLLNLEPGPNGLLNYPFSTTQTIIVYFGSIFLLLQMLWTKKHLYPFILVLFFMIQPIVVMLNVSGNFTIDINQRYVLIILPIFSMIAAVFVNDLLELILRKTINRRAAPLASIFAFTLLFICCFSLLVYHKQSFNENIHYKKNKLLEEEKFLNQYLKTLPSNSVFIYARPWQMISQHLNAFSETRFLNWNLQEFQDWQEKTNGNIYLVRGQDGYGKVNTKSRVVGFKTTDKVEQILKNYKTEELVRQIKPFGYALTVNKILSKSSGGKFTNNTRIDVAKEVSQNTKLDIIVKKGFEGELKYSIWTAKDLKLNEQIIHDNLTTITIESNFTPGIHRFRHELIYPDSSADIRWFSVYVKSEQTQLLTDINPSQMQSGWGNSNLNKSVERNSLKIKGEVFPWGIGTHTDSKTIFPLQKQYQRLHISYGMDDESMCGDGAIFIIQGDGKKLFESKPTYAEELGSTSINVSNINQLELITLKGETDLCDHSNWLNPWLEK